MEWKLNTKMYLLKQVELGELVIYFAQPAFEFLLLCMPMIENMKFKFVKGNTLVG